jgi:hypothetical protein
LASVNRFCTSSGDPPQDGMTQQPSSTNDHASKADANENGVREERTGSGWRFWIDRGGTFTDVIGREHAPPGLAGGADGAAGAQRLIGADGAIKVLPGCFSLDVEAGDAIEIETPGGGGYGEPESAGSKS